MSKHTHAFMLLTAAALAVAAAPANAQETWNWHRAIAAGKQIQIKGVNGDVSATAASGSEVEVVARKTAHRTGDPKDVKIEVVESSDGVTICAVYPTPRGDRENECAPGDKGHMNTRRNDVTVDFEVRVPRGVEFDGRTVNGNVNATGLTADAQASTVNGRITLYTTGIAEAQTVNGSIRARMGRANWSGDLEFETVNGSITLEIPGELNADVEARTVNGSISTDWPMTVTGKWGPRRMHGRIGSGGRELALSTVNGEIELKKY